MEGKGERGLQNLWKYASQMRETWEDSDEKDQHQLNRIITLYNSLYSQVFEGEMATLICKDLIDECLSILAANSMFQEAIQQKHQYIAYLKKENEIDHVMRRAYLEIVMLNILADDKFKIKDTIN